MRFLKIFALQTLLLLFTCCNMLDYHPYSGNIDGETRLTEKNLARLAMEMQGKTSFKFAFISDTQGWFDETRACVKAINSRSDISFLLHGGDLTDFALPSEFELMRDELLRLNIPWLTAIGNHDCLANGKTMFAKIFGATDYSFSIGNNLFITLNSNALEYDYKNVPDIGFLNKVIAENRAIVTDKSAKTFIVMHSHPGDDQFNNESLFELRETLKQFPNVVCLSGHTHHLEQQDCLGDSIPFYIVSRIKERKYLVFTIKPEGYEVETCDF